MPSRPGGIPYAASGGSGFGAILGKLTGTAKTGPGAGISATVHSHLGSARTHGHWSAASGHSPAGKAAVAPTGQAALQHAMSLEGVPASWNSALTFIMARESGGNVDVRNPYHSARGLFQLTAANYHYNPNGANSFGNGVEEAQGGIRYIKARYSTAENAVAFWKQHNWY